MIYLTLTALSFTYVFIKAFQQRNNIHNNWLMIPVMSYGLGFCEIATIYLGLTEVYASGPMSLLWVAIANGTGGCIGCMLAMWVHNRYLLRGEK